MVKMGFLRNFVTLRILLLYIVIGIVISYHYTMRNQMPQHRIKTGHLDGRDVSDLNRKDKFSVATFLHRNLSHLKVSKAPNLMALQKLAEAQKAATDRENKLSAAMASEKQTSNISELTSHPVPRQPKMILGDSEFCQREPNLRYLIYVHSSPPNVDRRSNIRTTWGNSHLFQNNQTKILFVFGKAKKREAQRIVMDEFKRYGDIIQGDFDDTYKNLTYKGILALHFITIYCKNVKFVIKSDDDTFCNIFHLERVAENQTGNFLACQHYHSNMPILRDPETCMKWCVEKDELPGQQHFPHYCAGALWMTTYGVVKHLYQASYETNFFWIDDVFISGLLLRKAVRRISIKDVSLPLKGRFNRDNMDLTAIYINHSTREDMELMWQSVLGSLTASEKSRLNV